MIATGSEISEVFCRPREGRFGRCFPIQPAEDVAVFVSQYNVRCQEVFSRDQASGSPSL